MGRILCFDFGKKRVGIAITDELKIISSPYDTIKTDEVNPFIDSYNKKNHIELIVYYSVKSSTLINS